MLSDDTPLTREIDALKESLVGSRAESARLRRDLVKAAAARERALALAESMAAITAELQGAPRWTAPKPKRSKVHELRVTPVLMLSDLHLDEVVAPSQVNGLNGYDRATAERRLAKAIENTVKLFADQFTGLRPDGIVCCLGGDIISGDIHDELSNTNEAPVAETIVHWVPMLAGYLRTLADFFGSVHVPCVAGNHDRTTHRTPFKNRAQSSFSWIIYKWIAMLCADDKRITFDISESGDLYFDVYDTTFLLNHGDGFRSGGGVGGLQIPMRKWVSRKYAIRPFDMAILGHYHTTLFDERSCVSSSTKGYDEYAMGNGFSYERPQHTVLVVTPEHGITVKTTTFCNEGPNDKDWIS
jgi:hypothetical protein